MVELTKREASIITSSEVRALQKATPAQLAQAESLIIRGKAGAVRGDPVLQPIVNALAALGVQSIASIRFKEAALERQRLERERVKEIPPVKLAPKVLRVERAIKEVSVRRRVFPQRKETFIAAVDIGRGRMQDFRFVSEGGQLIVSKPTGVSGPQSTRFKQAGRVGKSAREIALSRVGVLPDLEKGLTPTQEKIIKVQTALRKIGDKFAKLVPAEGGIEGLFSKKKPPSPIVIERVPSEPSAQATPIITARGKTFFENLGINPNSKNAQNLKKRVERTQSLFAGSVLNQTQAKARNDKALKDFQSKEIVKGIPTAIALGAGFALLQIVPVVGQVAGVLLGAELVLRRKEIVKQFKEFPFETAGSFAAFAAGGFVGGKALNKVTNLAALEASGLAFVIEKKVGVRKTPLSKTFPREIKFKINEKAVKTFAVAALKKSGVDFGKLSKGSQIFVTGQIKAFIRNNPAKLIPKPRQIALKNIKTSQLNKLVKQRLAGKFDRQIDFLVIRKRKGFQRLSGQDRIAILTFSKNLRQRRIIKARVKERKKFIKEKEIKIDKEASINKIIDQAVRIISEKKLIVPKGQIKPAGFVKKGEAFLVKEAPKVLRKEIIAHEKGHILFAKLRVHSKINKLSPKKRKQLLSISKATLKRLGVLKSLTNKKAKGVGLTKSQLIIEEFLVRRATPRIERAIQARKATAKRIRRAIRKGREPIKIAEVLTPKQRLEVRDRLLREIKFNPRKFISKTGRLALERLSKVQEQRAIGRAIRKGRKKIKIGEILSKTQKAELLREIKRQAELQPEIFIPKARREALKIARRLEEKQIQSGRQVLIQKQKQAQKQVQKIKKLEIVSKEATDLQLLALKRFKEAGKSESKVKLKQAQQTTQKAIQKVKQEQKQVQKQVQKQKSKERKIKTKIEEIDELFKTPLQVQLRGLEQRIKPFEEIIGTPLQVQFRRVLKQKAASLSKLKRKQRQIQVQKLKQKVKQKQKITQKQVQKLRQRLKQKVRQRQRQKLMFAQLSKQKSKLSQKLKQQQRLVQRQSQKEKQLSKQVSLFKQSFSQVSGATAQLQRIRLRPPIRPPRPPKRPPKKPPFRVRKKRIKKKVVRRLQPSFNVFAKSKRKFVKLNLKPLSRRGAKKLGSRVVDNTLSRTFKLKPTRRVKKLGKTKGKFKRQKFRTFKVRKKKRIGIKNTFIEKRKFAVDTRGEKKGLTVAKFLAQQRKPQKKSIKKTTSRPMTRSKPTTIKRQSTSRTKRKSSPAQLAALARGRKIMMRNRRK